VGEHATDILGASNWRAAATEDLDQNHEK